MQLQSPNDSNATPVEHASSPSKATHASLQRRVQSVCVRHSFLHESIRPLKEAPEPLAPTEDDVFAKKGLLTTRKTKYIRADAETSAAEKKYKKAQPLSGTKAFVFPSRRKKLADARQRFEAQLMARDEIARDVAQLEQDIAGQEYHVYFLKSQGSKLARLEQELDQLDSWLFAGPTDG